VTRPIRRTLEELLSVNSEQAVQRIKMGDHVDVAREIEHFAYFRRPQSANAAAAELRGCGFRTTVTRKGFGSVLLVARIESDVERDSTDAFVRELYELVERHGGFYDGYGGTVVTRGRT
jgi:hypothetical protein